MYCIPHSTFKSEPSTTVFPFCCSSVCCFNPSPLSRAARCEMRLCSFGREDVGFVAAVVLVSPVLTF